MKFVVYTDPGHGWVAVKRNFLEKHVDLKTISSYSYQRKDMVYLEEDCDASKLIGVLRRSGVFVEFVERHTNRSSKIRSYACFRSA